MFDILEKLSKGHEGKIQNFSASRSSLQEIDSFINKYSKDLINICLHCYVGKSIVYICRNRHRVFIRLINGSRHTIQSISLCKKPLLIQMF